MEYMEYMEYNEKKNLIKVIVLIIVIGILLNSYLTSPSKAYKALDSYFKKTYGEEFVIKGIGRRRLEDKEWYRKQIYEFVQFMKQTGTFEYVSLGIIVIDDRVLSKEFQENEELKTKLVENGEKYWEKDRRYYSEVIRRELMNKKLPQKITPIISLEDINKSNMTNSLAWSNYNILLSLGLYSSKYVESMGWNRDSRPEVYIELKNYNALSDIKFEDE